MPLVLNGTTGVQDNSGAFVAGTAVASTSGTSIDFTSIPSWVKRVTVMFNGVSTNGSSNIQIQIGSGSVTTSGYATSSSYISGSALFGVGASTGFIVNNVISSDARSGSFVLTLLSSNTWIGMGLLSTGGLVNHFAGNSPSLAGTLDRIRLTTVNGTDTFDAGSINIFYE